MFCLAAGVVLDSALSTLTTSELALCTQRLLQGKSCVDWLLLTDRNFGVFSVARTARDGNLLRRMTQARAAKLARQAGVSLAPGLDGFRCARELAPE